MQASKERLETWATLYCFTLWLGMVPLVARDLIDLVFCFFPDREGPQTLNVRPLGTRPIAGGESGPNSIGAVSVAP